MTKERDDLKSKKQSYEEEVFSLKIILKSFKKCNTIIS